MAIEGVDYAGSRPDPVKLYAAGKRFVVRYGGSVPAQASTIACTAAAAALLVVTRVVEVVFVALRTVRLDGVRRLERVSSQQVLSAGDGLKVGRVAACAAGAPAGLDVVNVLVLRDRPEGEDVGESVGCCPRCAGAAGTEQPIAAGSEMPVPWPAVVWPALVYLFPESFFRWAWSSWHA